MLSVLSLEEAFLKVLKHTHQNFSRGLVEVDLLRALGKTLAVPVVAKFAIPHFRRSTVDGYAVYAADVSGASESSPMLLPVAFEVLMGEGAPQALKKGTCAYVPTGGHVPDGADAMVMVEYCQEFGNDQLIEKTVAVGDHIVAIGEDVEAGDVIVPEGTLLSPHHMGALAALGYTRVPVLAPLKVALFSTGDEILQPQAEGQTPSGFGVYDANTSLIAATLLEMGASLDYIGHLKDDPQAFEAGLLGWHDRVDVVILSGGSSAGVRDLTESTILKLPDSALLVHGLSMQPGKPTIVGASARTLYIGLPGHPGACFMTLNAFVKPLLGLLGHLGNLGNLAQAMEEVQVPGQGQGPGLGDLEKAMGAWLKAHGPKTTSATLDFYLHGSSGRRVFTLVTLEDGPQGKIAKAVYGKSGMVAALAKSQGYVVLSEHVEGYKPGEIVDVVYW